MATSSVDPTIPRIEFNWILNRRRDLIFYIGSAVVGWAYVGVIVLALTTNTFTNPLTDAWFTLFGLPITLELIVVFSWAFLLDAPHLFATLARTFFDPDEWSVRRPELLKSWGFFFLGPVLILLPYVIGIFVPLGDFMLGLGALLFLVFFRLWAYYHVVRQHWGFYRLYKRKANDYGSDRVDFWFFQLSLYVPLIMFLTSSYYLDVPSSAFPDIGLHSSIIGGLSISNIVYPVAAITYIAAVGGYILFQVYLYARGVKLNGSKLLYMALIVPLHFVAFSHPIIVLFLTPIITVGHNIQYHQIVYEYGQKKYYRDLQPERVDHFKWARGMFKNLWIYFLVGLVFTFALYRGPWVEWLNGTFGASIDRTVLDGVGMMAGIRDIESLNLGSRIFGAFLLGWAMQHYYLDSKIWRVSRDKMVAKNLNV